MLLNPVISCLVWIFICHTESCSAQRDILSKGKGRKWCWHTVNNWQEHPSSVLLHLWYKKCSMTTNMFCVIGSVLQGRSAQGQEAPPLIIVFSFPIPRIHSIFHHKLGKYSRSWSIIQALPITSTGFHDDYGGNRSRSSYSITNKPFFIGYHCCDKEEFTSLLQCFSTTFCHLKLSA